MNADMTDLNDTVSGSQADSSWSPADASGPLAGAPITVRPARMDEADPIHRIVSSSMRIYCSNSHIPENMLDASCETVDDVRTAISSCPFFVAVDAANAIVGSVRLLSRTVASFDVPGLPEKLSLPPGTPVSYFSRFAVHEDLQGLGIGNLLFQAAAAHAAAEQSPYMLLHTSLSNGIMVSFYKKRGFVLLYEDPARGYPRGLFGKKLL